MAKYKAKDKLYFLNEVSGTSFSSVITQVLDHVNEVYKIRITESSNPMLLDNELVFHLKNSGSKHMKLMNVERFDDALAKYEAAKHYNSMLLAVDTNDQAWFEEASASYEYWKRQIPESGDVS
ncbi:hypothetical protein 055SW001_36 [Bacillus phage 055SW001]|nr:hypothetical protein 022DV001_36 [Bacillus phage 022DV001]QFG05787.1 hypothetical protein 055SW001_36 [Bacillus phage 055SW001]